MNITDNIESKCIELIKTKVSLTKGWITLFEKSQPINNNGLGIKEIDIYSYILDSNFIKCTPEHEVDLNSFPIMEVSNDNDHMISTTAKIVINESLIIWFSLRFKESDKKPKTIENKQEDNLYYEITRYEDDTIHGICGKIILKKRYTMIRLNTYSK